MTVSVLIPYTATDEHRARAREYVVDRYAQQHPDWQLVEGASEEPWSKGAALTDAASRADGDVFVVGDADSFTDRAVLEQAVQHVLDRDAHWVVPHLMVWRYAEHPTAKLYAGGEPKVFRGMRTVRGPYRGVKGGGITVLSRDAWNEVHGVDPRFVGWGGEDIAFGWALETLCGPDIRLDGDLHHLWHPPMVQGPRKRGSPASEALAGRYRDARHMPRLMRALVEQREPEPVGPCDPVTFTAKTPGLIVRNGRNVVARFRRGEFTTTDPDVADVLRAHRGVTEVVPDLHTV